MNIEWSKVFNVVISSFMVCFGFGPHIGLGIVGSIFLIFTLWRIYGE